MASSNSPSSSHEPTNQLAVPPSTAVSRRLPPPCWSHEETVALIDAYRSKWYSLQRGNLRAPHWQEVADGVASRCPLSNPPKTSIQCRHKMEKLRKRYRAEIQRFGNTPRAHRFPSPWVHFKQMDAMELGLSSSSSSDPSVDLDENDDELLLYPKGIKQSIPLPVPLNRRFQGSIRNGVNVNGNGNGVRIKIPNIAAVPPPPLPFDDYLPPMKLGKGLRDGNMKEGFGGMKRRKEVDDNGGDVMEGMVAAIQKLGDGFVKVERMKMDMARELESMRMKMEMKRTEMILDSHQKLVDSFVKSVMEKKGKKVRRMVTHQSNEQEVQGMIYMNFHGS